MGRKKDPSRELAFNLYKDTHNLTNVASVLGKQVPVIARWKAEDKWEERLTNDITLSDVIEDSGCREEVTRQQLVSLLKNLIVERLQTGTIVPRHFNDVLKGLEIVLHEERLDKGEPTQINKTVYELANKLVSMTETEIDKEKKVIREIKALLPPVKP